MALIDKVTPNFELLKIWN